MFHVHLNKSEAEAIAFLEYDVSRKKQKLYDDFLATASQLEQDKKVSTQENQARRDHAIHQIKQSLVSSSTKTWSDYQAVEAATKVKEKAAELLYAQTFFTIHHDYTQKKKENDVTYENEIAKLEHLFHDGLKQVSYRYASVYRIRNARIQEVRKPYHHALNRAADLRNSSERYAQDLTKKISDQVYAEAFKERNAAGEKHQIGAKELLRTSYEMVAKRIGLDGVTPDITSNVGSSIPYPYDTIQPIVGYMDLKWALCEAAKNPEESELIRRFYDVSSDDPDVDVVCLKEAVQSLDLRALSLVFKHQCLFMAPPLLPEERTLYVDFCGEDKVNLTVISPYGDILNGSYPITTEKSVLKDEIVANTTEFVQKLYYRNRAGSFDAFSALMASTDGFKAHVIKTIAATNRALKLPEGVSDMKLTKRHISCSSDATPCAFDETPSHDARKAYHTLTHTIDARYYARVESLKKSCVEAIHEAELLERDMCRRAKDIYDSECNDIDHEFAWDELAADISVHAQAFHYFAHPDECTALVDVQVNKVDSMPSEPDRLTAVIKVLEESKSETKPVFKAKTFGKSKRKPSSLFTIFEHDSDSIDDNDVDVDVDDDDDVDLEVCKIMGMGVIL